MRSVSDKIAEEIKTHILRSFLFIRAIYETKLKDIL
jgi:hypothetical protein